MNALDSTKSEERLRPDLCPGRIMWLKSIQQLQDLGMKTTDSRRFIPSVCFDHPVILISHMNEAGGVSVLMVRTITIAIFLGTEHGLIHWL
jgi:hypothetical protein